MLNSTFKDLILISKNIGNFNAIKELNNDYAIIQLSSNKFVLIISDYFNDYKIVGLFNTYEEAILEYILL